MSGAPKRSRSATAGLLKRAAAVHSHAPGNEAQLIAALDIGLVGRPARIVEHGVHDGAHRLARAVVVEQHAAMLVVGRKSAGGNERQRAQRPAVGIGGEAAREQAAAHRVADEIGVLDAHQLDEAPQMREAAPLAEGEIVDLVGAAEAEPVRRQHVVALGEFRQHEFPTDLRAAAEFAAVQQHDVRPSPASR